MKKLHLIILFSICVGFFAQANAHLACNLQVSQKQSQPVFPILASNCPKGCQSCWDQCTKSEDCGSGHKCIRGACGTRCVAD